MKVNIWIYVAIHFWLVHVICLYHQLFSNCMLQDCQLMKNFHTGTMELISEWIWVNYWLINYFIFKLCIVLLVKSCVIKPPSRANKIIYICGQNHPTIITWSTKAYKIQVSFCFLLEMITTEHSKWLFIPQIIFCLNQDIHKVSYNNYTATVGKGSRAWWQHP